MILRLGLWACSVRQESTVLTVNIQEPHQLTTNTSGAVGIDLTRIHLITASFGRRKQNDYDYYCRLFN